VNHGSRLTATDFCNKIGTKQKNLAVQRFLPLLGVQRKGLAQLSFVCP
jgi:hypothetical protein